MNLEPKYNEALAEVQRRVGQNVLMFQHLELMLKFMLGRGSISGTPNQLEQARKEQIEKYSKQTMGALVQPLITNLLTPQDTEAEVSLGNENLHLTFSFAFNYSAEERAAFDRDLAVVVEERNKLVHRLLLDHATGTLAGCQAANVALKAQFDKCYPTYERVRGLFAALLKAHKEFSEISVEWLVDKIQKGEDMTVDLNTETGWKKSEAT